MKHSIDQNQRLTQARLKAGYATAKEAANRFGWPYETYKKHDTDGASAREIDNAMAYKYGKAFDVDPGWILLGINAPSWDDAATTKRNKHNFRCVPKLTLEQAVQIPQQFSRIAKTSKETTIDDAPDIGSRSFSTEIEDDSMISSTPSEDSLRPGDEGVFDPDTLPYPGAFVCAHVEGEPAAIIRKYRPRGRKGSESIYELAPLNDDYPSYVIGPGHLKGRVIGVMIRYIRKLGKRA